MSCIFRNLNKMPSAPRLVVEDVSSPNGEHGDANSERANSSTLYRTNHMIAEIGNGRNPGDSDNEDEELESEEQISHGGRSRGSPRICGRFRSKISLTTNKGKKAVRKRRVTANLAATKYDVGR